jgi:hypothetical protein
MILVKITKDKNARLIKYDTGHNCSIYSKYSMRSESCCALIKGVGSDVYSP